MGLRKKSTSCRPLKLTEAQQIELRVWYYSARTVAEKARELGISRDTLYEYVYRRHKPRKVSFIPTHLSGSMTNIEGELNADDC